MNKLPLFIAAFFVLSLFSCGEDDSVMDDDQEIEEEQEEEIILTNEFNLDGTVLIGQNGAIIDVGLGEDSTAMNHYSYFFGISDGRVEIGSNGSLGFRSTSGFWISFLAESYNKSSFRSGIYTYKKDVNPKPNENFINRISVVRNGKLLPVIEGKVIIRGSRPTYTIITDLTLEGGKRLTGDFTGTFDID